MIYPQRLDDIQCVTKIVSHRLLGEKRKKQRDRVNTGHGLSRPKKEARDSRRKENDDGLCRSGSRRESRFDDRHCDRPDRWDDHRINYGDDRQGRSGWDNNRDYDYSRRVTLASASTEGLRAALDKRKESRKTNLCDSSSGGRAQ